ncbi:SWI/SNF and RSC complexes subunit ssr2 [Grifola frondosa]|uniref:SWI/SNF and RSC complexes subunit ssr2 n=1 Tax=Grifola frondosa TaxID=5627 RepID=A0A1C7LXP7_GRIFR|nr:SWI/SNF and RSC complexes subunit ssr2 [Grifola frondosa]
MSSPKRTASPSPQTDAKRIKLTVPQQNQGVTPVDPDNAAGKRSELEPIQGGDIGNLPPSDVPSTSTEVASAVPVRLLKGEGDGEGVEDGGDVSMAEGGEAGDEEADSAEENDDEDPAQLEATRLRLEDQARKYLAAQTHEVIIPSYSAWFDMSKIHPVERKALPEFFNSRHRSKTPAIYKDYRDFMVNTYRLRPSEYLTVTACRRNLAGTTRAPFTGHFRVILDTPRGLSSLHPGTRPHPPPSTTAVNGSVKPAASSTPASLELRSSIYQTTSKASRQVSGAEASSLANGASAPNGTSTAERQMSVKYECDTCGVDCTPVRYHSLKTKNFELCPPCYLDGRFPSTMFSGDFVKLTSAASGHGVHQGAGAGTEEDWSDQEILLLLEGVEMYDDDWSAIEEHVGSRTAQQCIRKFLQLPIEDPYVATEGNMGPLRYARIPFEQADNPVMSVVAFLAGVVGPGVAAEAAKTALHELTDGAKKSESETEEGAKEKEAEEEDGKNTEKKDNDGMEEDVPKQESTAQPADSRSSEAPASSDNMVVDTDGSVVSKRPTTIPHSKVVRAAELALKSSAKAAGALADAEDVRIRSTLASLIKLTLTKIELKMAQFEELEELLEEERKSLESARMSLVNERVGLKRMLDNVKGELLKHGSSVVAQAQAGLGTSGQGTRVSEVQGGTPVDGDMGPVCSWDYPK